MMQRKIWDKVYVGIQFSLFLLFLFPIGENLNLPEGLRYAGIFFAVVGAIVLVLALLQLNKNLTVFPTPLDDATLVTHGLYHYVRHPIYSGILFLVVGIAIWAASPYKLLIAFLLFLLFYFKTRYEETRLQEKYPDYTDYKRTHGRFFPKLFHLK